FLVDYMLQSLGTGLDTEEDAGASCSRHQLQQLIIDAIGARAAAPGKLFSAFKYGVTKCHHLLAVDGVHVVNQTEISQPVFVFKRRNVGNHPGRRLQTEVASEEIVRRTEGAGKWTAPTDLEVNSTTI